MQFASIAFDAFLSELGIQLVTGGTLMIVSKEELLPGKPLIDTLINHKISVVILAPSILKMIADITFPHLQVVMSAGEACPVALANKFSKKYTFINAYGPTEASVCTTMYVVDKNSKLKKTVPIGKAIGGIETLVLDQELRLVGTNKTGELYIGGVGVARGYHNDSELTQKSFITISGRKFYKSGDLVKYLEDGNLEYMGRVDRQVKYRGVRICLDEIEKIICEQGQIETAAAFLQQDDFVVCIKAKPKYFLTEIELRAYLRTRLPARMIPNKYIFLDAIPLTLSNKIDYQALTKHIHVSAKSKVIQNPGWSDNEYELLKIIHDLVTYSQIELDTNLFDLGIDSFLVVTLVDKIDKAFDIELQISKVYEHDSIKKLSSYIDSIKSNKLNKEMDFLTEIKIEEVLSKQQYEYIPKEIPKQNIFLTGATGFVGIFLLEELLRNTGATIYCLIRAANEAAARERLQLAAEMYQVDFSKQKHDSRVQIILGDLSLPFFGLEKEYFAQLTQKIDAIYHLACDTSFIKSYNTLKPINVNGAKEILRFATYSLLIPVNYVSTMAIFSCVHFFKGIKKIDEHFDSVISAPYLKYDIGYIQSKWVADQLMQQAMQRGAPVTIYRPGFILCHSATGAMPSNQFMYNLINECMNLGAYPAIIFI